ncbi:hypothetical protein GCM10008107_15900 [Psychrosphaera saromensis]|uniref:DUF1289 domain-containing protein n=1 Tax=Psychrosphaera saromensis TaxID=716813 RepID=A0A2S7UUK1_9GAMM|nr:DUF1289 domain-containing protein [Psychrosphaera saromensis]PQJ53192.1 hypothetical protein BTO11_05610 [Psychrosphaera saromensis]GHB67279.1 hypothetical protein GCM10008107_15900 [Psychrosphaera saromensis]GLQ15046.1 hypothetical protein GCM10007917_25010 [Psychrosphaera saromensis]
MIESPCIRECCLDSQDICIGCARHINEITGWQKLSEQEKKSIVSRCDSSKKDQVSLKGSGIRSSSEQV